MTSDIGARVGECIRERRWADALPLARQWIAEAPDDWVAHADLNVVAKHGGAFDECRDAGLRALALGGDRVGVGVHWNLGIAATALGDWALARRSWIACGLTLPEGEGPLQMPFGATPIRVGPRDAQEVVWCDRIDPARALVRSVPFPESGRRFGDLVLHDGEPRGKRRLGDREVWVFDELCLLERSPFATSVVVVRADTAADRDALLAVLRGAVEAAEDWTSSVRWMCRACSEGRPHAHHDPPPAWASERRIAIASRDPIADDVLATWDVDPRARAVLAIEEVPD